MDGQSQEAHPRSRGENYATRRDLSRPTGSSPLTRGKLSEQAMRHHAIRLIPAHAGKTTNEFTHYSSVTAHPRSRGENLGRRFRSLFATGSSPLTRGKPMSPVLDVGLSRLIPAHAGKTSRGCGGTRRRRGSSPLTRGKHFPTCAFTAQIDQILETLELAVSSGSYSIWVACATDAPQDQVRSIGLVLPSSRGAS